MHGPDIIGFQEIENINILERLFKLLEPHGYKYYALVEGNDKRGIDNAFISKYKILSTKLHQIKFTGATKDQIGDTRPILEGVFELGEHDISIFNVHFPAPYNPRFMRQDAFKTLNELSNKNSRAIFTLEFYAGAQNVCLLPSSLGIELHRYGLIRYTFSQFQRHL